MAPIKSLLLENQLAASDLRLDARAVRQQVPSKDLQAFVLELQRHAANETSPLRIISCTMCASLIFFPAE